MSVNRHRTRGHGIARAYGGQSLRKSSARLPFQTAAGEAQSPQVFRAARRLRQLLLSL